MDQPIFSHVYDNGLVLVAEPMMSLESAAFSFLVPAGAMYDPPARLGLSTLACEMSTRGAGERDNRQFVQDLENLGIERSESVSNSHASFSGATLARNLFAGLELFADLLRRPLLPDDQLEAARAVALQELRAIEDEPGQKVMLELRRHQYPDPLGRSSHGQAAALEAIGIREIRDYFAGHYQPRGTILGVAGQFDWENAQGPRRRAAGRLGAPRAGRSPRRARSFRSGPISTTNRTRRKSASPTTACPIAIPTIFRPGAPSAC